MKTMEQWNESKKSLTEFLLIGDVVSEDIKDYILCCLPPKTWKESIIQMGEPYSMNQYGNTYITIEKNKLGQWIYTGIKNNP